MLQTQGSIFKYVLMLTINQNAWKSFPHAAALSPFNRGPMSKSET